MAIILYGNMIKLSKSCCETCQGVENKTTEATQYRKLKGPMNVRALNETSKNYLALSLHV